jgi:hypothetical protein
VKLIKAYIQEERGYPEETERHLETTDHITSEDPTVVASFLRAVADRLDPPKKAMR